MSGSPSSLRLILALVPLARFDDSLGRLPAGPTLRIPRPLLLGTLRLQGERFR